MKDLLERIQIKVDERLYSKDPLSSELGKSIIKSGTILIDEIGLENFTFKKLASNLSTTESSIYRYFENKQNLMMYIISWYWGYMEYLMVFSCANMNKPTDKLNAAIDTLCKSIEVPANFDHISSAELNKIIIAESPKAFLSKELANDNKNDLFGAYLRPCMRLAIIIKEINPEYAYPKSLALSVLEGIISQKYYNTHLNSFTDFDDQHKGINTFYKEMVLKTLQK